jgi:hypothetical protein
VSRTAESQHGPRTSRARIYRAIPEKSRKATSQAAWLRAIEDAPELATLRADAERNGRDVANTIGWAAHWKTLVSRPGWDTLMDRTKLSRSTVAKWLKLLHEWGYLGRVSSGSTWSIRGSREDDQDGNLASEYVLCVPIVEGQQADKPVDETRTPSLGSRREPEKPHMRAREEATPDVTERTWPMLQPTATRQDRLAAAKRLQAEAPMLARVTPQLLRHVLRPQLTAGWTVTDILHALDHTPDGERHWHTGDVRHVAAWIRHRLKAWADRPAPRPVAARQSTALTAADVAALPRPNATPVADTTTHASRARQLLAATLKRRSDKPARHGLGVLLPDHNGETTGPAVELDDRNAAETGREDVDWLLRNAAKRAEPDLMRAFSGLGAIA